MLSAPTAKMRKGTTSIMMRVVETPKQAQSPRDEKTARSTMRTPPNPRVILESIYEDGEKKRMDEIQKIREG